ncbi:MAG: hypothetical protein LQ337_007638 [Flavoplaca oasis]|nr:MAG: hypothetical protein LQ337_007638 [Flavoplaca oasis]
MNPNPSSPISPATTRDSIRSVEQHSTSVATFGEQLTASRNVLTQEAGLTLSCLAKTAQKCRSFGRNENGEKIEAIVQSGSASVEVLDRLFLRFNAVLEDLEASKRREHLCEEGRSKQQDLVSMVASLEQDIEKERSAVISQTEAVDYWRSTCKLQTNRIDALEKRLSAKEIDIENSSQTMTDLRHQILAQPLPLSPQMEPRQTQSQTNNVFQQYRQNNNVKVAGDGDRAESGHGSSREITAANIRIANLEHKLHVASDEKSKLQKDLTATSHILSHLEQQLLDLRAGITEFNGQKSGQADEMEQQTGISSGSPSTSRRTLFEQPPANNEASTNNHTVTTPNGCRQDRTKRGAARDGIQEPIPKRGRTTARSSQTQSTIPSRREIRGGGDLTQNEPRSSNIDVATPQRRPRGRPRKNPQSNPYITPARSQISNSKRQPRDPSVHAVHADAGSSSEFDPGSRRERAGCETASRTGEGLAAKRPRRTAASFAAQASASSSSQKHVLPNTEDNNNTNAIPFRDCRLQ